MVWIKLLSFFRGIPGFGEFVLLIVRIFYEIRYFLVIWSIILFGFGSAYIIIFQGGNNPTNGTTFFDDPNASNTTFNWHFLNFGVSFVNMFKGSTGGGLDGVFRGDAQFANGAGAGNGFPISNSELYNLQLILYVLFSLACNVILFNLLIALMSAVYEDASASAAAQNLHNGTQLLMDMEKFKSNFVRVNKKKLNIGEWLHIIAPDESQFWDKAMSSTDQTNGKIDDVRREMEDRLAVIDRHVNKTNDKIELLSRKTANDILTITDLLGQIYYSTIPRDENHSTDPISPSDVTARYEDTTVHA